MLVAIHPITMSRYLDPGRTGGYARPNKSFRGPHPVFVAVADLMAIIIRISSPRTASDLSGSNALGTVSIG